MEIKVLAIANHLANRVNSSKRPYVQLKWIVDNCDWQYKVSKSELLEAYFAAINILQSSGIENTKRKLLSTLSKGQKSSMRKQAKELAAMAERFLNTPVYVAKFPIKTDRNGRDRIQIDIETGVNLSCTLCFYPTFEELSEWTSLDEANKTICVYKFVQRFKTRDERFEDNIETVKAKLEFTFIAEDDN